MSRNVRTWEQEEILHSGHRRLDMKRVMETGAVILEYILKIGIERQSTFSVPSMLKWTREMDEKGQKNMRHHPKKDTGGKR